MADSEIPVSVSNKSHRKTWLTVGLICLFLLAGGGLSWYFLFLKKNTATPLEAVPTNAAYIMQLNQNEEFTHSVSQCMESVSSIFSLHALEGFEFFIDQLNADGSDADGMTVSGHFLQDKTALLLSVKAAKNDFANLLKTLKINPKDFSVYKQIRIYEVGTHRDKFFICLHDGMFSAAENLSLLYQSIDCMGTEKCQIRQSDFEPINELLLKNKKQNWLIIHHSQFVQSQLPQFREAFRDVVVSMGNFAKWSAYVMTFSVDELQLSGYSVLADSSSFAHWAEQPAVRNAVPAAILPGNTCTYTSFNLGNAADFWTKSGCAHSMQEFHNQLNTQALHFFSFGDEKTLSRCVILQKDSVSDLLALLQSDSVSEAADHYHNFAIYACSVPELFASISASYADLKANYFIENQGFYIFADSVPVLYRYLDALLGAGTLNTNSSFLFAQSHVPSAHNFEYLFVNGNQRIQERLSSVAKKKKSALLNLKVFSFNTLKSSNGLIPNNIYVKFGSVR